MNRQLLSIYLNDHLAGAVVGGELAGRLHSSNKDDELGSLIAELIGEIEEDRRSLEGLMERLEFRKDPIKRGAAWLAEKTGRLKLNGRLVGYSPLSRLEELEALALGVRAKAALWRALAAVSEGDPEIAATEPEAMAERADAQFVKIEAARIEAARRAFASREGQRSEGSA